MDTIEVTLYVEDDTAQEFLIAELEALDFDGFVQEDHCLRAYIPAPRWDDVRRERVEAWLLGHGVEASLEERVYEPQNWNAQWEATIQPRAVGRFLVRPTWADTPPEHADRIVLEIDPKMSFGTGYHESTRLVLEALPGVVRAGDRVLDAGTGTGILAIAAVKLGAASALAFDVDPWVEDNVVENLYLNGVAEQVAFRVGTMDDVPEDGFDVVLANINRNVLVDLMPAFAEKLVPGGRLVLAGLLLDDRAQMLDVTSAHGFRLVGEREEGAWWSAAFEQLPEGG